MILADRVLDPTIEPADLERRFGGLRRLYGDQGSHYQRQGLKLSKHFRVWGD